MMRAFGVAGWICLALAGDSTVAGEFSFFHENVMGTSLELRVEADSERSASEAESRVLKEIDRLSAIFSNYDASSELRRWQAGSAAKVSSELFDLLQASDWWHDASGGAFDPRVQTLITLWKTSAKQGRTPSAEEIREALAVMKAPAWRLDLESRTASGTRVPITLDAIAKGFIVERACDAAMAGHAEVTGILLNIGGDLRVRGDLSRTIGITPPRGDSESAAPFTFVRVSNRALATSGDYQRGLLINEKWYSHIFDPRTGQSADLVACASVVAKDSADADALATTLNVLSPEEGLALIGRIDGAECLIVARDGRISRSEGWKTFEVNDAPPTFAFGLPPTDHKPKADEPKKEEFELLVDFEIKAPEGNNKRRYRRPYVAIWLDDKDGNPVRNLVLWVSQGGSGPERWLPDLKKWYPSDKMRLETDDIDLLHTVARATRAPGKYSVIWDGKDNHGKPLPKGEYTLTIETAREHGTYQIIRTSLAIADAPFAEELKGNAEIQSAAIAYRRKASAAAPK